MITKAQADIKARLDRKAAVLQRVFSTPDGLEVLEYLDEEFTKGVMFSQDPRDEAYKLGARDVVIYLQQLVKFGETK